MPFQVLCFAVVSFQDVALASEKLTGRLDGFRQVRAINRRGQKPFVFLLAVWDLWLPIGKACISALVPPDHLPCNFLVSSYITLQPLLICLPKHIRCFAFDFPSSRTRNFYSGLIRRRYPPEGFFATAFRSPGPRLNETRFLLFFFFVFFFFFLLSFPTHFGKHYSAFPPLSLSSLM